MKYFIIRIDLKPFPLFASNSAENLSKQGAMLTRILKFGRKNGAKFQFFTTSSVLQSLPATVESIISERHDLDLLLLKNQNPELIWQIFQSNILKFQEVAKGLASDSPLESLPPHCQFAIVNHQISAVDINSTSLNHWFESTQILIAAQSDLAILHIHPEHQFNLDPDLVGLTKIYQEFIAKGFVLKTARTTLI